VIGLATSKMDYWCIIVSKLKFLVIHGNRR
jgi:hypothetical protein